jgi:hypothetical protein
LPRLPHDEKTAADRLLRLPLDTKPAWDARRRELRVGDFLVKRFRVPAENQSLVLSAFEEEGWPAYIDDPLPMKSKIVPKQRLHNAITRLNGSQLVPILRFHGNGNGDAIGWQLLPRHALHEANGIDRDSAVAESDQRHQSAATPCPRH